MNKHLDETDWDWVRCAQWASGGRIAYQFNALPGLREYPLVMGGVGYGAEGQPATDEAWRAMVAAWCEARGLAYPWEPEATKWVACPDVLRDIMALNGDDIGRGNKGDILACACEWEKERMALADARKVRDEALALAENADADASQYKAERDQKTRLYAEMCNTAARRLAEKHTAEVDRDEARAQLTALKVKMEGVAGLYPSASPERLRQYLREWKIPDQHYMGLVACADVWAKERAEATKKAEPCAETPNFPTPLSEVKNALTMVHELESLLRGAHYMLA